MRDVILRYVTEKYGTKPEYLWEKTPDAAVLRHSSNKKWYGIMMHVQRRKLGISGDGSVDILNVKCDPLISGSLRLSAGILPGYHMNKASWITILLDGTVPEEEIFSLLDMSFELTKNGKNASPALCSNWIIPANPRYYDIDRHIAESENGEFLWKQSKNMTVGNSVFIYITAPVSGIKYRCTVVETDIPLNVSEDKITIKIAMRLRLDKQYDEPFSLSEMRELGVYSVRGARSMPEKLVREINKKK